MNLSIATLSCCAVTLCLASPAAAESTAPLKPTASTTEARTLTGKERLGPKWTDEQRLDNCKVPPDKRGTKPRPILCPDHMTN